MTALGADLRRLWTTSREREAEESISIPWNLARVCPESTCRAVFNARAGACPACGTVDTLSLSTLLDPPQRIVPFRATLRHVERN